MSEKEYGTYGPSVDAETFFENRLYREDGIDTISSKEFSCYISEVMDRLGYSYEMVKHRQHMFTQYDANTNIHKTFAFRQITTGGKAEGTALYENDIDAMYEVKQVVSTDNPQKYMYQSDITLFQTEMEETSPGYTRLKLIRFDGIAFKEHIEASIIKDKNCSYYLSSQLFIDEVEKVNSQNVPADLKIEHRSGPSSPASDEFLSYDRVHCFRCVCPNFIERRRRRKGWPSPETVHEISKLDGHVVPVGFKGSPTMDIEWRICFSRAELNLIRSLNEAQLKVYILLKKLAKSVLKRVCKEMTSYIMKNIVFWMCETKWDHLFLRQYIIDRLIDCLQYLRKCVEKNSVCCYMIPERNLLGGRLDGEQRHQVVSLLDDLIKERGTMLLRCDKIREAMLMMYKTPNNLEKREYSEKRDKIEKLVLSKYRIQTELWHPLLSNDEIDFILQTNEAYQDVCSQISHLIHYPELLIKVRKSQEQLIRNVCGSWLYITIFHKNNNQKVWNLS